MVILSVIVEIIEEPFEISHDVDRLNLLEKKLKDILKKDLKTIMEETEIYHFPVLGNLFDKEYFVVAGNILKIKNILIGNKKSKNRQKGCI